MGRLEEIQEGLKSFMRLYPQGVTIVTAIHDGRPVGLTVSAFIPVSLEPPLVLFSIDKSSYMHGALSSSRVVAVNLLAHDQSWLSDRFAGRHGVEDKFSGIGYRLGSLGAPILEGVIGYLECRAWRSYDGGDHTLFVCEVVKTEIMRDEKPLVYYRRGYTTLR